MSPAPKPPPWPPAGGLGRVRVAAATIILSSHTHIHQLGLLVLGTRLISISARIFFILHVIVVVWRTKVFSHWGVKNVTNTTMTVVMKLKTIEKPQRWIAFSVFCGQSVVFYMINPKYIWQQTINSLLIHLHGDFSLWIGCDKSNLVLTISSDSGIIKVNWHKNVHHYYLLLWKSLPIELFFGISTVWLPI